ncbi:hypothetical protein DB32_001851 [Sandaracinus amylolyticus]|uniref:Uncharacterized protein n=1 Tax=Sandaracinus amylolyticus TaxID=927083 RepID=A0A0F6W185_9BACT|nr:hypothetical protein DB32_001851 [Sandaracinus amylolyticus]
MILTALAAALFVGCDGATTSSPAGLDPRDPSSDEPIAPGTDIGGDAGVPATSDDDDAGTATEPVEPTEPTTPAADAGTTTPPSTPTPPPATPPTTEPPSACVGEGCTCVRARELWADDFETGDNSAWTGQGYGDPWGDACQSTAVSTVHPHSGRYAQRSEIVCPSSSPDGVHRGYGGLQFSGEDVLPNHTNVGTGLDAPNGIVSTFHTWLEPGYQFGNGRWVSLFTINPTCGYTERVITLGLDNPDGILRPAHHWPEGTLTIEPDAQPMPLGRWVRITVYVNFHSGEMHVWQDGQSIEHVTGITRATKQMCQWHWGLYASGDNTDIVMFEDDMSIWKLDEAWSDWSREPWLGETQSVCD